MRNRRDRRRPNKSVYHATIRTIHGLPFVARPYMNMLLLGIIARGQSFYPVQIVALTVMANHPHIILAGRANLISSFMNYIDGELAQAIECLFPTLYHGKVWKSRFTEQALLTPEDVIDKIAYTYANPARAGLVDSIEDFNGISTWKMFATGSHSSEHPWVRRATLKPLPSTLSVRQEKKLIAEWKKKARYIHALKLSPYVWRKCFPDSEGWTKEEIHQKIVCRLQEKEEVARVTRTSNKLLTFPKDYNDPRGDYRPKYHTATPFVQCHLPDVRKKYIDGYKYFCFQLQEAARLLRRGLLRLPHHLTVLPPGGYLPGGILSSVLLYAVLPSG